MPTFTYKCPKCNKEGDLFVKKWNDIIECYDCHVLCEKLVTAPMVLIPQKHRADFGTTQPHSDPGYLSTVNGGCNFAPPKTSS